MTKEDDFHRLLDAKADDWQLRMIFADWLDDHGDTRAAGYRAIAAQQRRPLEGTITLKKKQNPTWWWHCPPPEEDLYAFHNYLPRDWFDLLPPKEGNRSYWPAHTATSGLKSRRECEDALAVAFVKLPPERQAELLTPPAALKGKGTKKPARKK